MYSCEIIVLKVVYSKNWLIPISASLKCVWEWDGDSHVKFVYRRREVFTQWMYGRYQWRKKTDLTKIRILGLSYECSKMNVTCGSGTLKSKPLSFMKNSLNFFSYQHYLTKHFLHETCHSQHSNDITCTCIMKSNISILFLFFLFTALSIFYPRKCLAIPVVWTLKFITAMPELRMCFIFHL